MVLIAVCVVPFQIELQLENYVLELGLGGAFPIDNQLGKYGFKAWFGGAPLSIESPLESDGFEAWPGGAPSNRKPIRKLWF